MSELAGNAGAVRVLSAARVDRTLDRLTSEVVERQGGTDWLVVVGIKARGTRLGRALAERLGRALGRVVPFHELDASGYRDDRAPAVVPPDPGFDVQGRDVVLVDDVLHTGRTVRAALDALVRHGRPRTIQLAVLVDRGDREYPIQPDYVCRWLPTPTGSRIVVRADEGFAVDVLP